MNSLKPKEPLLAVLLSFILPGLGQVYGRRVKRGLALLSINVLATLMALAYLLHPQTKLQASTFLLLLPSAASNLFIIIDAYRCVKAWNLQNQLSRKITAGKRAVFILGIITVLLIPNPTQLIARYVRSNIIAPFKMPARSMEPTLVPGDRLLVDKAIYRRSDPKRGDIIVFKYPDDPKRPFIKRLVGLPSETVEIRNERLIINGKVLQESGVWTKLPYYNDGNYGQRERVVRIPTDSFYVLGDNSASSLDSRVFGFVPRKNLIGKAYKIFYPFDRSGPIDNLQSDRIQQLSQPSTDAWKEAKKSQATKYRTNEQEISDYFLKVKTTIMERARKSLQFQAAPNDWVKIAFTLAKTGEVENVYVKESSGNKSFEQEGIKIVQEAAPFSPPPDGKEHELVIPLSIATSS